MSVPVVCRVLDCFTDGLDLRVGRRVGNILPISIGTDDGESQEIRLDMDSVKEVIAALQTQVESWEKWRVSEP